ncbi:unnamed protein product [Eruca vesicaria subsp. sativa]|uniref:RNase H type-1 domain-containing protein n=1 Tax=Eruca vesicaria subsp. sativa TaxID=29727 RepID=A0ABC8IMU0_ERUVS|nr:unnamed protein product [Eruca vesicaria subsp. sativa]
MESELSALIWSMQACSSLGNQNVIVEGENISIHKYINQEAFSPRLQHLVSTVRVEVEFHSLNFVHGKQPKCKSNMHVSNGPTKLQSLPTKPCECGE